MKNLLLCGVTVIALAGAPALAQPEFTTSPKQVAPPANMSCDDQITNAELKLQTVIDYEQKSEAEKHMKAAQDAIEKDDPATCKAEVQKALDAVK
jgi:hypothetical protein